MSLPINYCTSGDKSAVVTAVASDEDLPSPQIWRSVAITIAATTIDGDRQYIPI